MLNQAQEKIKLGTRQYASRQKKWIKNRLLGPKGVNLCVHKLNATDLGFVFLSLQCFYLPTTFFFQHIGMQTFLPLQRQSAKVTAHDTTLYFSLSHTFFG